AAALSGAAFIQIACDGATGAAAFGAQQPECGGDRLGGGAVVEAAAGDIGTVIEREAVAAGVAVSVGLAAARRQREQMVLREGAVKGCLERELAEAIAAVVVSGDSADREVPALAFGDSIEGGLREVAGLRLGAGAGECAGDA